MSKSKDQSNDDEDDKDKKFFRHPLTLLIIGALLTSIVIPMGGWMINENLLNAKARRDKAVYLLEFATTVDTKINAITTEFEIFEKDILDEPPPIETFKAEQAELRKKIHDLYSQLNGPAWWALYNIAAEARISKFLSSDDQVELQKCADEYVGNLNEVGKQIDILSAAYIRSKGIPDAGMRASATAAHAAILELYKKRALIVRRAGELFQDKHRFGATWLPF